MIQLQVFDFKKGNTRSNIPKERDLSQVVKYLEVEGAPWSVSSEAQQGSVKE